jgi:hypothetical protein
MDEQAGYAVLGIFLFFLGCILVYGGIYLGYLIILIGICSMIYGINIKEVKRRKG